MKDHPQYLEERLKELQDILMGAEIPNKDNNSKPEEKSTLKCFIVSFGDKTEGIHGERYFIHDNGMLQIFKDSRKGEIAALFRKWDSLIVEC